MVYRITPPVPTTHEWNRGDSEVPACRRYTGRLVDRKAWIKGRGCHMIRRDAISQNHV